MPFSPRFCAAASAASHASLSPSMSSSRTVVAIAGVGEDLRVLRPVQHDLGAVVALVGDVEPERLEPVDRPAWSTGPRRASSSPVRHPARARHKRQPRGELPSSVPLDPSPLRSSPLLTQRPAETHARDWKPKSETPGRGLVSAPTHARYSARPGADRSPDHDGGVRVRRADLPVRRLLVDRRLVLRHVPEPRHPDGARVRRVVGHPRCWRRSGWLARSSSACRSG